MLGQRGGLAPPVTCGLVFSCLGGVGGGGVSFILVTTRVHRLRTSLVHPVPCRFARSRFVRWTTRLSRLTGHDGFYFGGLFVLVVGSVVAFGRFEVPFPQ